MESISWIFDGLGTEIFSLIVGLISGGAIGYKIGIHNRIKQSQKARNNSRQTQISSINYGVNPSLTGKIIFHKFSVYFEGFRFDKYLIIRHSVF